MILNNLFEDIDSKLDKQQQLYHLDQIEQELESYFANKFQTKYSFSTNNSESLVHPASDQVAGLQFNLQHIRTQQLLLPAPYFLIDTE